MTKKTFCKNVSNVEKNLNFIDSGQLNGLIKKNKYVVLLEYGVGAWTISEYNSEQK